MNVLYYRLTAKPQMSYCRIEWRLLSNEWTLFWIKCIDDRVSIFSLIYVVANRMHLATESLKDIE